jgi:hypothetical protein
MKYDFASKVVVGCIAVFGILGVLSPVSAEAKREGEYQGITYITGGVGEEEREHIEAAAGEFNLKLICAREDGAFVSDVQITVKDKAGAIILQATSDGPLFYAKLPPGNYLVEAIYESVARQSEVAVAATGQGVVDLRWSATEK